MTLPLSAAFYVSKVPSLFIPVKAKQKVVSDVFQYDARPNFVHWKDTQNPACSPGNGLQQQYSEV